MGTENREVLAFEQTACYYNWAFILLRIVASRRDNSGDKFLREVPK